MPRGTTAAGTKAKRPSKRRKLSDSEDYNFGDEDQLVSLPHSVALHILQVDNVPRLQENLLRWFDKVRNVRGMPWRRTITDPSPDLRAQRAYEVWVSEIMLQQTQVATVIPYYNRWMEKFPTIQELATADIDTVNALWKGLGYYSRAARLLAGAQKVVNQYGGHLPSDTKLLEKEIPGIGRYSAGAICSIAYGNCVPILDGNVHRLLSRILALHAPPKAKKTLDILWEGAEAMVKNSTQPGDVNQALIELGSTVCRVRDPICEACPLKDGCGAYTEYKGSSLPSGDIEDLCEMCEPVACGNAVTRFPMKAVKKKSRIETDAVNVIEWRGKSERYFALVRRPEKGLLAGLYEFPSMENIDEDEIDILDLSRSVLRSLLTSPPPKYDPEKTERGIKHNNQALCITSMRHVGDTVHIFSHIRKTYQIVFVVLEGGESPPEFNNVTRPPTKKQKTHDVKAGDPGARAKWVLEGDVANANIGTGVLNVWKKVRSVWEFGKF